MTKTTNEKINCELFDNTKTYYAVVNDKLRALRVVDLYVRWYSEYNKHYEAIMTANIAGLGFHTFTGVNGYMPLTLFNSPEDYYNGKENPYTPIYKAESIVRNGNYEWCRMAFDGGGVVWCGYWFSPSQGRANHYSDKKLNGRIDLINGAVTFLDNVKVFGDLSKYKLYPTKEECLADNRMEVVEFDDNEVEGIEREQKKEEVVNELNAVIEKVKKLGIDIKVTM